MSDQEKVNEEDPELDLEEKEDSPSQADRLVELALDQYRVGQSPEHEPFVVPKEGPKVARLLRGGIPELGSELFSSYRREHRKTPTVTSLTAALKVLEGECAYAPPEALHLRVAEAEGAILVDLGDETGQVIQVSPAGWRILDESPVLFRRTVLSGPLPMPERGGDLRDLADLLNLEEGYFPLVLAWLCAALMPNTARPVVLLGGQQGTGKSTAARLLIGLVDPGPAPLRTPPRGLEEWAVSAQGSWVVAVDNVSRVPEWWSDAICRAVTGDGLVRRKLYTDQELSVLSFRRVVMLTSIDAGALRGDLGDRLLFLDLAPIGPRQRREEAEITRLFQTRRPRLLGALLDLLVRVLAQMPQVELEEKSRMADFCRVVAAVERVLGTNALEVYLGQRQRVAMDVIESDVVAVAIRDFMADRVEWAGTFGDLLDLLFESPAPKGAPRLPHTLSGRIRRLVPSLQEIGIEFQLPSQTNRSADRTRKRIVTIRSMKRDVPSSVQSARASENGIPEQLGQVLGRTLGDVLVPKRPSERPQRSPSDYPRSEAADASDTSDAEPHHEGDRGWV